MTTIITVSIGGKTFDFWLDTGASLTVVSSRTAEAIGLLRSRAL